MQGDNVVKWKQLDIYNSLIEHFLKQQKMKPVLEICIKQVKNIGDINIQLEQIKVA